MATDKPSCGYSASTGEIDWFHNVEFRDNTAARDDEAVGRARLHSRRRGGEPGLELSRGIQ